MASGLFSEWPGRDRLNRCRAACAGAAVCGGAAHPAPAHGQRQQRPRRQRRAGDQPEPQPARLARPQLPAADLQPAQPGQQPAGAGRAAQLRGRRRRRQRHGQRAGRCGHALSAQSFWSRCPSEEKRGLGLVVGHRPAGHRPAHAHRRPTGGDKALESNRAVSSW